MKSKSKYENIRNVYSLLKFFYYVTIFITSSTIILLLAIPFISDLGISFEEGIREWVYSVEYYFSGDNHGLSFGVRDDIPYYILQSIPRDMIDIHAAIIVDMIIGKVIPFIIVIIGLKYMIELTKDILAGESPFQIKYLKWLRKLSYVILIYAILGNTLLCTLISIFASEVFCVTISFSWLGVLIGIAGLIFSDITEQGLFLQNEYDTTL